MNRQEAIGKHRDMWGIITEALENKLEYVKREVFLRCGGEPTAVNSCFLCEYSTGMRDKEGGDQHYCKYCPLDPKEEGHVNDSCLSGLFKKYSKACGSLRAECAEMIRDFPNLNEVKEET